MSINNFISKNFPIVKQCRKPAQAILELKLEPSDVLHKITLQYHPLKTIKAKLQNKENCVASYQ